MLPLLLVGYAAFYLCRATVEPALNLLAIEHGYDNERMGIILALALGAYAFGKLVLGPLSDVWGGKRLFVLSLVATGLVTLAIAALDPPRRFGAGTGLVVIGALVVTNRFVQAGGWGGLVHVVGATFPAAKRGTVMGILSTSYDAGNVVALVLCAGIVSAGYGWRALFVVNPALLLVIAAAVRLALPHAALPAGTSRRDQRRIGGAMEHLVHEPSFWFATGMSFLLTFVRAGFMTWTPRFLYEVSVAAHVTSPISSSIAKSAFFGVAGIVGSLVTGRLSDRLGPGRRIPIMSGSLAALVCCTLALAHAGVSSPVVATVGVAACGLFLLGPYSLLAGAISLDIAGDEGAAATTASIVDAAGYVGASLAAVVLGSVSKRAGWTAAFDLVAGVAMAAMMLSLVWARRTRMARRVPKG